MTTLNVSAARTDHITLDETAINAFDRSLSGRLIRPGQEGYETTRLVWNGMIDRRPALIAQCASVEDVIASVNFVREHGLLTAVRGGGHNVAGHGTVDGGLVIDLSPMKGIVVDPEARITRADGGVTWGELDHATQQYGLATPGGVVSDNGIAGLTLGGGFGYLRNKYGLSCDNLVAAEVVLADGRAVRASETENADLLWGLRGGGGNFGVVTAFEYRLHPVGPEVMFVFVLHEASGDRMWEGLKFYRDYSANAPDEVSTIAFTGMIPPGAHAFPEEIHGAPYIPYIGLYAGPIEDGKRILQALRDFGKPLADFSGRKPYVEAQSVLDEEYPAHFMRYYWKSLNLMELSDAAIDRLVEHARRQPSPYSTVDVWHVGGAVKRFGSEHGAFHGRHAAFLLNPEANWKDAHDDVANIVWARDLVEDMREFSDGSRYLNFAGLQEEGADMMRDAFGPQYERLRVIKQKYDPMNLFRLNQNIELSAPITRQNSDATFG